MPEQSIRFTATVANDGSLRPPRDAALRLRTVRTVDVEITLRGSASKLDERDVTAAELERIAAAQRLEPDVAEFVLCGEGAVMPGSALFTALQHLASGL